MKNAVALLLLVVAGFGASFLARAQAAPLDPRAFMRAKLEHSQQLLSALAVEDFKAIEQHAGQLKLLALDANWQVLQTPEYAQHSTEFRSACDALTKAAESRNLDSATLAYFQVTLGCVNCHKYVRDANEK